MVNFIYNQVQQIDYSSMKSQDTKFPLLQNESQTADVSQSLSKNKCFRETDTDCTEQAQNE